ncbi:hypothetical protein RAN3_3108 [plant metagenome]|uniref:Uncharacterized protein n=1 Tax=plant metagenome TaxID=1297885 RepID=A0A484U5K2_9ZZZZ
MATSSVQAGALPAGFTSPFKRVPMRERIDDALACVAILTNRTLDDVNAAAIKAGYPAHGPAWAAYPLIAKLLAEFGTERSQDYKEFVSTAVMPDVAILLVNYDPETEIGRHVVWHHVRGTERQPSFNYVIDPASWIEAKQQITMDLRHLRLEGGYYIEVKPLTYASVKGK